MSNNNQKQFMAKPRKFNIQKKWFILSAVVLIFIIVLAGGSVTYAADITFPNHGPLDNLYNQGLMDPTYPDPQVYNDIPYTKPNGRPGHHNIPNPYNSTTAEGLINGLVSSNRFDNGYIRINDNFIKISFENMNGAKLFRIYNPGMYCVDVDVNGDGHNEECSYAGQKFYYQLCDLNGNYCGTRNTLSTTSSVDIDIKSKLTIDPKYNFYSAGIKLSIDTPNSPSNGKIIANPYRVTGITDSGDVKVGFMGPVGSSTQTSIGRRMALRNNISNINTNWAHWYGDKGLTRPKTDYRIRMTVPNNAPTGGEYLRLGWYDFDSVSGNPSMKVSINGVSRFSTSNKTFLGASNAPRDYIFDGRTVNGVTLPTITVFPGDAITWELNNIRFDNNIGLTLFYDGGVYPAADIKLAASVSNKYVEAGETVNFTNSATPTVNSWVTAGQQYSYSITDPAPISGTKPLNETVENNSGSVIVPDLPIGSQYCREITITGKPDWATFSGDGKACATIGKKPKVQIWGGDLLVRGVSGLVTTSTSVKDGLTFGSWAEYGIIAGGKITGAASGAAFAGVGLANPTVAKYSTLSFSNFGNKKDCVLTNTVNPNTIGCYKSEHSIPEVAASFPVTIPTNIFASGSALTGGLSSGVYKVSGNSISINGGNIERGQWIVINAPNATINIGKNINYSNGTMHSISDLPQVVIIAKKIIINRDVTNVDAWLIAKNDDGSGSIQTCDEEGKAISQCTKKLVVNGPVMTNKLYLRRTFGSGDGATSGEPAEVFNLRADAYLWAFNRASINGRIQTVYTTELPPRF